MHKLKTKMHMIDISKSKTRVLIAKVYVQRAKVLRIAVDKLEKQNKE